MVTCLTDVIALDISYNPGIVTMYPFLRDYQGYSRLGLYKTLICIYILVHGGLCDLMTWKIFIYINMCMYVRTYIYRYTLSYPTTHLTALNVAHTGLTNMFDFDSTSLLDPASKTYKPLNRNCTPPALNIVLVAQE